LHKPKEEEPIDLATAWAITCELLCKQGILKRLDKTTCQLKQ